MFLLSQLLRSIETSIRFDQIPMVIVKYSHQKICITQLQVLSIVYALLFQFMDYFDDRIFCYFELSDLNVKLGNCEVVIQFLVMIYIRFIICKSQQLFQYFLSLIYVIVLSQILEVKHEITECLVHLFDIFSFGELYQLDKQTIQLFGTTIFFHQLDYSGSQVLQITIISLFIIDIVLNLVLTLGTMVRIGFLFKLQL